MQLKCFPVSNDEEMQACIAVRQTVFIEEQQVPAEREQDGLDEKSFHFGIYADGRVIGTCRVRLAGSAAKIERVAVLKEFRNKGIGGFLMRYILQELGRDTAIQLFKLSSQAQAIPFYERLGFVKRGAEYMDAGIPHYDMVLEK